jgi:hypothetical protein
MIAHLKIRSRRFRTRGFMTRVRTSKAAMMSGVVTAPIYIANNAGVVSRTARHWRMVLRLIEGLIFNSRYCSKPKVDPALGGLVARLGKAHAPKVAQLYRERLAFAPLDKFPAKRPPVLRYKRKVLARPPSSGAPSLTSALTPRAVSFSFRSPRWTFARARGEFSAFVIWSIAPIPALVPALIAALSANDNKRFPTKDPPKQSLKTGLTRPKMHAVPLSYTREAVVSSASGGRTGACVPIRVAPNL